MDTIGRSVFFDTGAGGGGRYSNNENLFHSFFPVDTTSRLRVKIYSFSTEASYDHFTIYSGSTNPSQLVRASGAGSFFVGNSYKSTAADGSLSFQFTSDGSVNDAGWYAVISSCNENRASLIFSQKEALCSDDGLDLYVIPHCNAYDFQWQQSLDSINWTNVTHYSNDPRRQERLYISAPTTGYYRFRSQLSTYDTLFSNIVYIHVDTNCYSQSGTQRSVSTCGGTYYDSGQRNGNYNNNEFRTKTFYPSDPTQQVLVNFTHFAVDSLDTLNVYNGSNINAPLMGQYTGNANIGTIASTALNGSLTFEFISNGSGPASGWEAQLSCYCSSNATIAHAPVADLCASQDAINLTGGNPAGGIYLGNGIINSSGIFDPNLVGAGSHLLTYIYTDNSGCVGDTTFYVQVLPTAITTDMVAACNAYTWSNGITYTNSTTAIDTLIGSTGCDSIMVLNLTINNTTAQISQLGNTLTTNISGATYQWIDCATNAPIAGATHQNYRPTANGTYAVIITNNNCTDTSNYINVLLLNTQEPVAVTSLVKRAYPNPTQTTLTIELSSYQNDVQIQVLDVNSKIVLTQNYSTTGRSYSSTPKWRLFYPPVRRSTTNYP